MNKYIKNKDMYVSTRPTGMLESSGIGYVIIPQEIDREKYIEFCYRTGTISMAYEVGGRVDTIPCAQHVFNEIVFPKDYRELGSLVTWIKQPKQNQPLVIGIMPKNETLIQKNENQSSIYRTTERGFSEVLVDGNKSNVYINASSLDEQGGDVILISKNNSNSSSVKIFASGSIDTQSQELNAIITDTLNIKIKKASESDNETTIRYVRGEGFEYSDEFGNVISIKDGVINIDSENINIGGEAATEFLLKGNTTVNLIDQILNLLSTTTAGPWPLATAAAFASLRTNLEALKSKKHKIE